MEIVYAGSPVRLDRYLRTTFPGARLPQIYMWIRMGKVKVNGKKEKQTYRLQEKDKVTINLPEGEANRYKKETVSGWTFSVLYEDKDLLIINKPPFLASQPGMGVMSNNVVTQVKYYLKQPTKTVALANRLDKETSGIIVVGKNRIVNGKLYDIYKERRVSKYYTALVVGHMKRTKGLWRDYLKRTKRDFQHRSIVVSQEDPYGEFAETEYHVKRYYGDYTLLDLKLNTGRMHQIRIQAASRGYPVVGDKVYGNEEDNAKWKKVLKRQFLHASTLYLMHPMTGKPLKIEAPLADDLKRAMEILKLTKRI